MGIDGISQDDYNNNKDVVRQAIADALGMAAGEIFVENVEQTKDGVVLFNVHHAKDVIIPTNFKKLVETNLTKIDGLSAVSVVDFSNFKNFDV